MTSTDDVADIAYLAFTAGYTPGSGDAVVRVDLAGEAIRLVRVLRDVLPPTADRRELDALLALMLLQALIAAEHAIAPQPTATAWDRILARYDELVGLTGSPVVRLNRAVAVSEVHGPDAGLDALADVVLRGHRLPAVRAELLARAGRTDEARDAYDAACALCGNEAERAHLRLRRDALA
ncbi:hypothetical protein GCM10009718_06350 [Isoptericola halotolerans]|uniref:RNA polymerase sigma factor n=1 Tax=Isoptericola halotolerans TaxID=300560 RepID=A0ABX2A0T6_9MICO|nr:DUF6596 domain-containing protein [Isoptericola halotolerans]NOV96443.1 putative RNA polymerase sigma factor [Isoptericola halotolerans]